jgi:hypothetical protein
VGEGDVACRVVSVGVNGDCLVVVVDVFVLRGWGMACYLLVWAC